MKVLLVNAVDSQGGAARAMWRLFRALQRTGVDVEVLVNQRQRDDAALVAPQGRWQRRWHAARPVLDAAPLSLLPAQRPPHFSLNWLPASGLVERIRERQPDIVHLHWVNAGMMNTADLPRIAQPLVWTLHDNWAFTGGCHVSDGCRRFERQCGQCPQLASSRDRDLSRWVWRRKQRQWQTRAQLDVIAPSQWMADCARASSLLGQRPVHVIPNVLDEHQWSPVPRAQARQLLGLPADEALILFGAYGALTDRNKGFDLLQQALAQVRSPARLLVSGSDGGVALQLSGRSVQFVGHLHDDIALRLLYCAADLTVVPSRQENLCNTILESLACGTPVVAFACGGNGDLVRSGENGWLAPSGDTAALAGGIDWVLQQPAARLAEAARGSVLRSFAAEASVQQHLNLYEQLLRKPRP